MRRHTEVFSDSVLKLKHFILHETFSDRCCKTLRIGGGGKYPCFVGQCMSTKFLDFCAKVPIRFILKSLFF